MTLNQASQFTQVSDYLTTSEHEQLRQQTIKAMRKRLDLVKPDYSQFAVQNHRASHLVIKALAWAKAFVPIVALLAAVASSVRTVQTASEIYLAAGSHPVGVFIAALAFTLATEGSLFVLALAQEDKRLRNRAEKRTRHVLSLKSLWRSFLVRIGVREPVSYDQLPEQGQIGTVIAIAFLFAVAANAYMGLRPLIDQIGPVSLQDFLMKLIHAQAAIQMTFIVDMAAVLFPPLMALAAGHLTAQFAEEIAEQAQDVEGAYQDALGSWQEQYRNPLTTAEGQELLKLYVTEKTNAKLGRRSTRQQTRELGARTEPNVPLESNQNGHTSKD